MLGLIRVRRHLKVNRGVLEHDGHSGAHEAALLTAVQSADDPVDARDGDGACSAICVCVCVLFCDARVLCKVIELCVSMRIYMQT